MPDLVWPTLMQLTAYQLAGLVQKRALLFDLWIDASSRKGRPFVPALLPSQVRFPIEHFIASNLEQPATCISGECNGEMMMDWWVMSRVRQTPGYI